VHEDSWRVKLHRWMGVPLGEDQKKTKSKRGETKSGSSEAKAVKNCTPYSKQNRPLMAPDNRWDELQIPSFLEGESQKKKATWGWHWCQKAQFQDRGGAPWTEKTPEKIAPSKTGTTGEGDEKKNDLATATQPQNK